MKTKITFLQMVLIGLMLFNSTPSNAGVSSISSIHSTKISIGPKKKKVKREKEDNPNKRAKVAFIAGLAGLGLSLIGLIVFLTLDVILLSEILLISGIVLSVIGVITGLNTLFRKDNTKKKKLKGLLGAIFGGIVILTYKTLVALFATGSITVF